MFTNITLNIIDEKYEKINNMIKVRNENDKFII
jgi:hypothetical protein